MSDMSSRLYIYFRLLALNTRLFREGFKLDSALVLIGLLYVFGGRSKLDLTISTGIFLLAGCLSAALMEIQIIKNNAANFVFYMRLPINQRTGLALFYLALALPVVMAFAVLFLLLRTMILSASLPLESSLLNRRLFQAIFAILFMKSLSINSMIAMSIHIALIAVYFIVLSGVLLALLILQELIMPLFIVTDFTFALLFLLSTYLISFIAVKKIGL